MSALILLTFVRRILNGYSLSPTTTVANRGERERVCCIYHHAVMIRMCLLHNKVRALVCVVDLSQCVLTCGCSRT